MSITATHEEAQLLSAQTSQIIGLILEAQAQIRRKEVIEYFKEHPEQEVALLAVAQSSLKTYPLIVAGLRETLLSNVLPAISDAGHQPGWIDVGDVFVGWVGYAHNPQIDSPYIITADTEDGYEWRRIYEPEGSSRPPMQCDPFLGFPAWHKIEVSDDPVVEIEAYQQAEIDALQGQIAYFQSNAFMES